ncbi:RIC1-domain-containing protein [Mycotypha africana]|uniref:RIC1-domain-containing protein n=1 Tax=Mycotypha africana TaxID=64632 RepID=UPI0023002948|nr:RIC1-domain-containing protein [Mycotypha africana]KAI8987265.1 RIC1-domain-containing protein [Mycotypha africana]
MYWLNGIASQITVDNILEKELENSQNEEQSNTFLSSSDLVTVQPSQHAFLYITCTRNAIYLWSVKPNTVLAFVERSKSHVKEFGENLRVIWKPDTASVVVQTTNNYLLLYAILSYDQTSFEFSFPNSYHAYVTGPGEGKGVKTMLIKFKIAIRVDAGIACGTSTDDSIILSTKSPAAIQCISWMPQHVNTTQTALLNKLNILENEETEFVTHIEYDKSTHTSVWLSNEGKAYFVQNNSSLYKERRGSTVSNESTTTTTNPVSSNVNGIPVAPSYIKKVHWTGVCFHGSTQNAVNSGSKIDQDGKATTVSINYRFSLIAVGTSQGTVYIYSVDGFYSTPKLSHKLQLPTWSAQNTDNDKASIESLEWTSDGYALAVGYKTDGIALWSVYGSLLCTSKELDDTFTEAKLKDTYIKGLQNLFWGPGNHQLFILAKPDNTDEPHSKLFVIPVAKSALTSYLHSDNVRRGLLQMDDRILIYNNSGDYQENDTTMDPAAVAWTHIQYPALYITDHWPIRYASISSDGKHIAVAGRRGFTHYNTILGRWKLFGNQHQEESFIVRSGMVWYNNILIVACENLSQKAYEIRLYSSDSNLDNAHILYTEQLPHMPFYMSLCGNFLLLYTSDNTLHIYHIIMHSSNDLYYKQSRSVRLDLIRTIDLKGFVARAVKLRSISLFNPTCGDQLMSVADVFSANLILLYEGKLMLLFPRVLNEKDQSPDLNSQNQSPYNIHVLHPNTDFYWISRKAIDNLVTSIWIMAGNGLKIFTNLLLPANYDYIAANNNMMNSEPSTPGPLMSPTLSRENDNSKPFSLGQLSGSQVDSNISSEVSSEISTNYRWRTHDLENLAAETIHIDLDFFPLSVILERGIIVGIEQSIFYRDSLGFALFKMSPKMHLFLHHILRYLLERDLKEDAFTFASAYEKFVYFGHALEILLHNVLEDEAGKDLGEAAILPSVIRFLDQFPHALDVIVSCARKTEVALWDHLFSVVGKPQDLFELCLRDARLRTATSYLIILQTMQPSSVGGKDTMLLIQKAIDEGNYDLCKELVRFLSSIDTTGKILQEALLTIKSHMKNSISTEMAQPVSALPTNTTSTPN